MVYRAADSPSSTSILNKLFSLIRDLPKLWQLWKKKDYIRGLEAIISSIMYTRFIQFLSIPSSLSYFKWITVKHIHPCDLKTTTLNTYYN